MVRWRSLARRSFRKLWFDRRHAKYHFIHIPKNAGEAVRDALFLQRDVSLSSPFHYRYVDVVDRVGRDLRYFAIVRNPWSRTASRYQFARQNAIHWPIDDPRRLYISRASFADFVKDRRIFEIPEHPGQPWMGPMNSWFNQLEWIRDDQGRIACDCLRMECLNEDLSLYLGRTLQLQRRNVTHAGYDYRSLYTDELAGIVRDVFSEDIVHFGFTFEGPATRNVFAGR
jgi:hypothetical protein